MIKYRRVLYEDLIQIAQIHKEQFKTHFLGMCSLSLIMKFYESFISESIIFIVAEEDCHIKGFVMGGTVNDINHCQYMFIQNNRRKCVLETLTNPYTWKHLYAKMKNKHFKKMRESVKRNDYSYRLLSIAVKSDSKRIGIGKSLIISYEEELAKVANNYGLCVESNNYGAISLYEKMGFSIDFSRENTIGMSKKCRQ